MDVLHSYFSIQQIQMVLLSRDLCPVQPQYFHVWSAACNSKRNVSAVERKRKVTDVCECKEVLWKQRWGAMLSIALQRFLWKLDNSGVLASHASLRAQYLPIVGTLLISNPDIRQHIYLQKMQGLRFSKSSIKQNKSILKRKLNRKPMGGKKNLKKISLPISLYSWLLLSFFVCFCCQCNILLLIVTFSYICHFVDETTVNLS